jgi:hypothetical protein
MFSTEEYLCFNFIAAFDSLSLKHNLEISFIEYSIQFDASKINNNWYNCSTKSDDYLCDDSLIKFYVRIFETENKEYCVNFYLKYRGSNDVREIGEKIATNCT